MQFKVAMKPFHKQVGGSVFAIALVTIYIGIKHLLSILNNRATITLRILL